MRYPEPDVKAFLYKQLLLFRTNAKSVGMAQGSTQQKKRGRPPSEPGESRDHVVIVRLRGDEREVFDGAAGRAGLTLSAWIRRVLLRAAKRQK